MQEYMVDVDHVSMRFNMTSERVDHLKEYFVRLVKKKLFYEEFWALEDVSLRIKKGGMFGLVGYNGAGKSTLLKLIAGVMKPTKGSVMVKGEIAPLIELGAGFDPDLSARENVFLNGAVLGYSEQFMNERYDEIIDFAELYDFQEVPIKNFSSGMYMRLAFSVATMVKPDILITDEILSVGDYRFQKKCMDRIQEMMKNGTTVLLVSHSISMVRTYCDDAAWLDKGKLIATGPAQDICDRYEGGMGA